MKYIIIIVVGGAMARIGINNNKLIISFSYNEFQELKSIHSQKNYEIFRAFFEFDSEYKCWISKVHYLNILLSYDKIPFVRDVIDISPYREYLLGIVENYLEEIKSLARDIKKQFPFLYPYQAEGVAKILYSYSNGNRGYGLFWDVGTGKTVTSFTASYLISDKCDIPIIVLCPSSLIYQWKSEIEKFFPDLKNDIQIIGGSKQNRVGMWKNPAPVNITTYETWRNDVNILDSWEKFVFICDEASKLKNATSQITKLAKTYIAPAYFKILCTATPYETHIMNYYNIMSIIDKDRFAKKQFEKYFIEWEYNEYADAYLPARGKNHSAFAIYISDIGNFLKKEDVKHDLPQLQYIIRIVERDEYTLCKVLNVLHHIFENEGKQTSVFALKLLANGIDELKEAPFMRRYLDMLSDIKDPNEKLRELEQILEEIGEKQVLIFTQFERSAKKIYNYLFKKGYNVDIYTGSTKNGLKLSLFKEGKLQILVATDCLAYGISFPDVDYEICYDIHWNPARMDQRAGRIHRITSKNPKTVIWLVSDFIEKSILDLIKTRKSEAEIIEAVLSEIHSMLKGEKFRKTPTLKN